MATEKIKKRQFNPAGLDGRVTSDGSDLAAVKDNLSAMAAPTGSDDSSAGYSVSSMWFYAGKFYRCRDASVGAAVWEAISVSGHTHAAGDISSGTLATARGGVPTGGTTGQALVKASAADNDVEWAAGGGIADYGQLVGYNEIYSTSAYIPWNSIELMTGAVEEYGTKDGFEVSAGGIYLAAFHVTVQAEDAKSSKIELRVNGTAPTGRIYRFYNSYSNPIITPIASTTILSLSDGDNVRLYWSDGDGGGSGSLLNATQTSGFFSLLKIG